MIQNKAASSRRHERSPQRQPARLSLLHVCVRCALLGLPIGTLSAVGTALAQAAQPAAEPAAQPTTLPAIRVSAQPDAAGSGYVAKRSATGTKTDTPIVETPQSISVVTREQMDTLKVQRLSDALGYSAGAFRIDGDNRATENIISRGFQLSPDSGSMLRDGMKYQINSFDGQLEPYGLERIELLKGASSVLFGSTAPGGLVNTVTKRPSTERTGELNAELGNHSRKQLSGDITGPLTEDGTWSYRLTGLVRDSKTGVDQVPDDRLYIAPALTWRPSAATSLTLLAHHQETETRYLFGLPARGTLLPNPNGKLPTSRFIGEPGYDRFDSTIDSVGYLFDHAFSDSLRLRHGLRYVKAELDAPMSWTSTLAADGRTLSRFAQDRFNRSTGWTSDTSLEAKLGSGRLTHTVLAGVDVTRQEHDTERYNRALAPLDLFNPVYGAQPGPRAPHAGSTKERRNRVGLYVQDQIKFDDKWVVLAGVRRDRAENSISPFFGPEKWNEEDSSATTGRLGLVYLADNGLAPFASFSQSFEPQGGLSRLGARFKPTEGEQVEVGVRYQPRGSNALYSAALYELTQQNVLTPDPVNPAFSVQTGEIRARGFELEARTRLGRNVNLIAAYAYTDARVTQSNNPAEINGRVNRVPYNQLSLWGDVGFDAFGVPGWKVGAGVRYIGATRGGSAGEVPAYTLVDAVLSLDRGPWRYALNATNLTDKEYVSTCTSSSNCFYGPRRAIIGSVGYRW
jgi:iron complex outermembrane receptor protein